MCESVKACYDRIAMENSVCEAVHFTCVAEKHLYDYYSHSSASKQCQVCLFSGENFCHHLCYEIPSYRNISMGKKNDSLVDAVLRWSVGYKSHIFMLKFVLYISANIINVVISIKVLSSFVSCLCFQNCCELPTITLYFDKFVLYLGER